jgi:hypothetical protein
MKASEIGVVDKQYTTISHLGHILHPGDTVMGYRKKNLVFFVKHDLKGVLKCIGVKIWTPPHRP